MQNFSIRRRSAGPLASGLAVAQLIATLFVRRSNLDLQDNVSAMQAAGWMPFPAGPAVDTLDTLSAAFWGGLFYTLSVGAALSLATWGLLYLWRRFFHDRPALLWIVAGLWGGAGIAVNTRGWVLFPTLFVICVPLATALASLCPRDTTGCQSHRWWPMPLITLLLLTGMWSTQLNERLFTTIRDHVLLSNAVGRTVNDFYYRYTLHAARTFKSFGQLTLRTCRITTAADAAAGDRWITVLAGRDIVATPDNAYADMVVEHWRDARMTLVSRAGDRLEIDREAFLSDPDSWLRRFSEAADRYAPLRRLTFAGLLIGFPILLFVMVDGAVGRLAGFFVDPPMQTAWRCGICLGIGILLFIPVLAGRTANLSRQNLDQALAADHWTERVAALRWIEHEKIDLAAFPQYRELLKSPRVVERYYVARALAFSRTPGTFTDLLTLIRDSHPNVVCQAYYALGQRRNAAAIHYIEASMRQSDHWYTQWYGYRALRSLGWRQSRSK